MSKNILTQNWSEPLAGARAAKVDIDIADGNLTIDKLTGEEQLLATGILQYVEGQGLPTEAVNTDNGLTTLSLKARSTGKPWFHLPWAACNAATEWHIHLNPDVPSDITAHSGGGNLKLNLVGMAITCLSAETGGGNMGLVLPDNATNLNVTAKTGAGNVTVEIGNGITGKNTVNAHSGAGSVAIHIPRGIAARIHATSGTGKAIVDSRFNRLDKDSYQSPDYESAGDKVEISVHSGAGKVRVDMN